MSLPVRVRLRLRPQHIQVLVELAQRVLQKRVRRDTNLANYRGPVYLPTLYFRQSARAQRLDAVLPADFSLQRSPAKKVRRHVATPACVLLLPVLCGGSTDAAACVVTSACPPRRHPRRSLLRPATRSRGARRPTRSGHLGPHSATAATLARQLLPAPPAGTASPASR